jgi:hypothetical protein
MKLIKLCGVMLAMVLTLFTSVSVRAEFDPALLSQSTVRILIKTKQGVVGAASGFLWQSNDQIVTSLHVMSSDPKAKIIVEFGKIKRRATIKAVLPNADLVLLQIKKPVKGWLPLKKFNATKPKYKSDISALGFNRGSMGMSTRELRKGFVNPESLKVLLPPDALQKLTKSKVLDLNLPIYYLDGSLLPGYSGSPVVDAEGELIGIGDGGLESGAASVSWVIPAINLDALMGSTINKVPQSLDALGLTFSGDVISAGLLEQQPYKILFPGQQTAIAGFFADVATDHLVQRLNPQVLEFIRSRLRLDLPAPLATLSRWLNHSVMLPGIALATRQPLLRNLADADFADAGGEDNVPGFTSVSYQQFDFVKVKSRTYQQMVSSTGSPINMNKVFDLYQQFFDGYLIDYQKFVFDVYEDGRFGLNIAIPQGTELQVDDNGFLLVQGEMFCRICNYEIQYHARVLDAKTEQKVQKNGADFLNVVADEHWKDLNEEGDYGEYSDFRDIESFGSDRYVLRAAFADFAEPFKDQYELNYFPAATHRDAWFQGQGILNRFDEAFIASVEQYHGTDCRKVSNDQTRTQLCHDIETMFKIMISVHLTSFSNKFYNAAL